jgi:solute:Na+ symporter, SSS family
VNFIGIILGLGFVLSFGYWRTNFLVVQRALASEDQAAAERTPLIATFPKLFFQLR